MVCINDGELFRGKADTTHYDLKVGFFNAARFAAEKAGLALEDALREADAIVYSTTVGTNALIERRGSRLGLDHHQGLRAHRQGRPRAQLGRRAADRDASTTAAARCGRSR